MSDGELVQQLVPHVYDDVRANFGMNQFVDLSRSNRCSELSKNLLEALTNRGVICRRELHTIDPAGNWHYLVAHSNSNAKPSDSDIITDLNPWQYIGAQNSGYLHGERAEIQDILAAAGAPEWFVSLRGITTITQAHTTMRGIPGFDAATN